VGIASFEDTRIASLQFPTRDVEAIRDALLRGADASGYSEDRIVRIHDSGPAAPTRPHILSAFDDLSKRVKSNDMLFVFISSHGVELDGVPYIVTRDSRLENVSHSMLSLDDLFSKISGVPARSQLVILDACHSGFNSGPAKKISIWGSASQKVLERNSLNRAVVSSSLLGQLSYESTELGAGVLAHFLIQSLVNERHDRDRDGALDVDELFQELTTGVSKWSSESGRQQSPWKAESTSSRLDVKRYRPVPRDAVPGPRVGLLRVSRATVASSDGGWKTNVSIQPSEVPPQRFLIEIRLQLEDGRLIVHWQEIDFNLHLQAFSVTTPLRPTRFEVLGRLFDPLTREVVLNVQVTERVVD